MPYGITNTTSLDQSGKQQLLAAVVAGGIQTIDTARAYGDSEATIGAFFKNADCSTCSVITKLSPFSTLSSSASQSEVYQSVIESVNASKRALGQQRLDIVLLHRAVHLTAWGGSIWHAMRDCVARDEIGQIGVSIQSPNELFLALQFPDVAHIQLPYNLLDWRWDEALFALENIRSQRPLTVHARSVLLQGLLTTKAKSPWAHAGMTAPEPIFAWLDAAVVKMGRRDITDLCIAYNLGQRWIDGLVVGIDNIDQLHINLDLISRPALDDDQLKFLSSSRPHIPEAVLDPAQWGSNKR